MVVDPVTKETIFEKILPNMFKMHSTFPHWIYLYAVDSQMEIHNLPC